MKSKQQEYRTEKCLRYSIRKVSFGAASVAVAALFMFLGNGVVSADELGKQDVTVIEKNLDAKDSQDGEKTVQPDASATEATSKPEENVVAQSEPASKPAESAKPTSTLDKSQLESYITEIEGKISAGKYANKTEESLALLNSELSSAKSVLASATSQDELKVAYNKLVTVVSSKLKNKPVEKTEAPKVDTTNGKETVAKKVEKTEKNSESNSIANTGTNDLRNGQALDKNNAFRAETSATHGNFNYSMEYSNGKEIYLYNEEDADVDITVSSTAGNITKATVKAGSGQFVLKSKSDQAIAHAKGQNVPMPQEEEVETDGYGWSYHQTLSETQGPVKIKITGKPNDTFKALKSYTKTEDQRAVLGARYLQLEDSAGGRLAGGNNTSAPGYFNLVVKSQTYKYNIQSVTEENKVAVADINKLTTDDINKIKEKINIQYSDKATKEDARLASKKGEVLQDRSTVVKEVTVANGTVTVTYNDDSVDTTPVANVARTNPAPTVELPYSNPDKKQIYVYTGENTDLTFKASDDTTVKDLYLRGPGGVGNDNTAGYGFTTGKIENDVVTNGEGTVSDDKRTATIKMTGVTNLKAGQQWTSFIEAKDNDDAKSMTGVNYDASTDDAVRQQKPGYVQFIVKNQTSKYDIATPTEKVTVEDPANVTEADLEKIKEKLQLEYSENNDDANLADKKGTNVDDKDAKVKSVTKDDQGNLVVTYKDGSVDKKPLSEFVNLNKQPAIDAVNKAAEDKIAEINKTPNATDEEKAAAIAKVNADKEKAVAAINDANVATKAELEKAKEAGTTAIGADNPVVAKKDAAKADVEATRKAKADAINADTNLSQAEKDAAIAKINKAAEDATKAIEKATTDAAVDAAKEAGNTAVGNVTPVAKEEAKKAIAKSLEDKNAEIDKRTDLTTEEKAKAKEEAKKLADAQLAEIAKQPDVEATPEAAKAAQDAVDAAKKTGVDEVTAVNPTAVTKPDAKKAIDEKLAKQLEDIANTPDATDEEKAEAVKKAEEAAKNAKDAVDAATTDATVGTEKEVAVGKDGAKGTIDQALPVVKDKPNARKAIEDEAKAKKAEIDARNDLSPKAKEVLKAKVDKVANKAKAAIDAVTSVEDVSVIEEADKAAIKAIGDINRPIDKVLVKDPNALTDEEKAKILEEVKKVNPTAKEVKYDDNGKIEVTTEAGDKGTINPTKLVKTEDQLDNGKGGNDINKPLDKVIVKDPSKLTDEEKAKIVAEVEEVNPDAIVTIDENGTVSVSTPDGKTAAIPATDLVRTKEDTEKAGAGNSNILKPADKVVGEANDPDDQAKAEEKLRELNPDTKSVKFDENGNATVTLKDGTTATIPSEDLFKSETDVTKPNAGNDIVKPADKTLVKDPNALTDAEKEAIVAKVKEVNPDATVVVDEKGKATVTTKDGKTAVIPGKDLVKTTADAAKPNAGNDIVKPADKTVVANPDKLTDAEKKAIEDKVKAVNPDATVAVDDKGNATVTTPEGKTAVIPAANLTKSAADATKPNAGNDIVKPAGKTVVANPDKLTDAEKKAIEDKVKAVNPDATVAVDDKGNATVTTPEGKTAVIPAANLTKSAADAAKPNAGNDIVKPADKTVVANPEKLTDAEKKAIATKVKAVNPGATVVVDDKGNATVTTPEGKTAVIPAANLTKSAADAAKPNAGNDIVKPADKTVVANPEKLTDAEKKAIATKVKAVNPGSTVAVDDKGNATVTLPNGKTAVIPASDLTKSEKDVNDGKAKDNAVTPAAKTKVANPEKLTDAEKKAIEDKVKAANPGAEVVVDDKGNATVVQDGNVSVIPSTDLVKVQDDANKPNGGNDANTPAAKTVVKDPANLTDEEKAKVKKAVEAVNPDSTVVVDDKGNATVTKGDGTVFKIPASDLVIPAEKLADEATNAKVKTPAVRTLVGDKENLTDAEKEAVKKTIEAVNPGATVVVDDKGNATVTMPDGSTATISKEQLVKDKEAVSKSKHGGDNLDIDLSKVMVTDLTNITPEEKAKFQFMILGAITDVDEFNLDTFLKEIDAQGNTIYKSKDSNVIITIDKDGNMKVMKDGKTNLAVNIDKAGNVTIVTKEGQVLAIPRDDAFKQRPSAQNNGGNVTSGNNGATNNEAKVDKAKLEGAIRQLDELIIKESAKFDAETAKEANKLSADAKKVFANADATQAEVDAMVKRIEDFMAKVASSTDHATPANDQATQTPAVAPAAAQAASNASQEAAENARKVAKELPNTGTADSVAFMVAAAASTLLGLGLAGRRRKEDEEA